LKGVSAGDGVRGEGIEVGWELCTHKKKKSEKKEGMIKTEKVTGAKPKVYGRLVGWKKKGG